MGKAKKIGFYRCCHLCTGKCGNGFTEQHRTVAQRGGTGTFGFNTGIGPATGEQTIANVQSLKKQIQFYPGETTA